MVTILTVGVTLILSLVLVLLWSRFAADARDTRSSSGDADEGRFTWGDFFF